MRKRLRRVVLVLATSGGAAAAAAQGTFVGTGRPGEFRQLHTATLLPDGHVLVVGGSPGTGPSLSSAELYDPGVGTWTATAPMAAGRASHTATLLANGRVLVAGGNPTFTTAELYDPATGTWASLGAMGASFSSHTATLLSDGRVLLRGGTIARLYDPALGTWSSAGSGLTSRSRHAAALLPDGRVLVVGGLGGSVSLASAEIYNPATGTWTNTGSMANPRREHTVTLLANGRALAVGGRSANNMSVAAAELYDPGPGTWTSAGSLAVSRGSHTATLLADGRVLVAGGLQQQGFTQSTAELYDPGPGTWTSAGSMTGPRTEHSATLLADGRVLVANGGSGVSADLYYPVAGAWSSGNPMAATRGAHTATLLTDGRVLVAGGAALGMPGLTTAERYDASTGTWSGTGPMANPRHWHTATRLTDGRVLVTGGTSGNFPSQVFYASSEIYDPGAGTWTATGSMLVPRYRHSATLLPNGKILVVGGRSSGGGAGQLSSAEIFDPGAGTWTATAPTAVPHEFHSATMLADGRVLVFGGPNALAELYNPDTGSWSSAGFAAAARFFPHTATRLRDGSVLIAGGQGGEAPFALAELYHPAAGTWSNVDPMTTARTEHTATLLPDGRVLVAGGRDTNITSLSSTEIYDPSSGSWTPGPALSAIRVDHSATLLTDGRVLIAGGGGFSGYSGNAPGLSSTQLYDGNAPARSPRPLILTAPAAIDTALPFSITGNFRGDSEASGGGLNSSAANYPIVEMRPLDSARWQALRASPRPNFWDDPMTLSFDELPPLDPGMNLLTVAVAGIRSAPRLVEVQCGVAITAQPQNATVALNQSATFSVRSSGGLRYQWYRDGVAIPGAIARTYTTPLVQAADSGLRFHVVVTGACPSATATSSEATLTVADTADPSVSLISPAGGEYWVLSPDDTTQPLNHQLVAWSMSDDIRICRVEVSLRYSNDGGASFFAVPAGGGLPASFGPGGTCAYPGEGTSSVEYVVPRACSAPGVPAGCGFPSGFLGSLYKIRVTVTDQAGNQTTQESPNPFYIVQPNPDTVRTLILKNTARMQLQMGVTPAQAAALDAKLLELAGHPRVQGFVVDLNGITSVNQLYAAWDADPSNPDGANQVLFGCHAPFPAGCTADQNGIHDTIRTLLQVYTGVKYLIVAGDDRIVPFARIQDRTVLLPESAYPAGSDLTPTGTTVGQALSANKYLSDDPLAVADGVRPDGLNASLYVPDFSVGRLVETPAEITTAIATFISQDGILDLSTLDPATGHKVLVTGYDFLSDSAKQVRGRWKTVFGADPDPNSLAPVDGQLVGGNWGLTAVGDRIDAFEDHLSGNGGARYGLMSLSGHATHYKEGVPGTDPHDIEGLGTSGIASLDLAGSVVYAVGCHGGLPVPGSNPGGPDHSLDLPQTFLSKGVVAYVANTGYGWGLKHGIGYGERLVQLLTEELTKGGTIVTGDAVKKTKQRYFLETPRYDPYDEKSLMQWALFGLPMYAVKTGFAVGSAPSGVAFEGDARKVEELEATASFGGVRVEREAPSQITQALPSSLTQLNLHFDFTAPGVYRKWTAEGDEIPDTPGCSNPSGCYYTLNGLVERSSGASDLPVQPYFIYDSRLSGTSQHGVLWKGGAYDQETGWIPVIGELQSNGGDGSNHGGSPEVGMADAIAPRLVGGKDPEQCRPSDLELNSLVVGAGEAMKDQTTLQYSIERRYRQIDLEVFYFNNTADPAQNCNRDGPVIPQQAAYHTLTGSTLNFAVPASDPEGVWRVLVVVNDNSTTGGQGQWVPVELQDAGGGLWTGSKVATSSRMTYVIQAVDNRGNVTWVEYQGAVLPASGVPLGIPLPVMVNTPSSGSLSIDDVTASEGNAGTTTATFTVTLTPAATAPTTVNWATAPNTATSPSDFVTASGTLTFEAGQSTKTIDVTVNGDGLFELNEIFLVNLSDASGAAIVDSLGVGTIMNDDALPSLSVGDVTLSEGNSGLTTATFSVTLSTASVVQATVNYTTQDVTAQAGSDYAATSGTLTFAAGETVKTISVTINGDGEPEADELFTVSLSGAANASLGDGVGAGTIVNDDAGPARAFVSVVGLDTNDCSNIATPCRTLNAAIVQVAADGEVIVTKTGSYAGATVTKGVKLSAAPGIVAFSGQPVTVNAPGATVVIRGLTIKALTPGTGQGVLVQSAGAVFVESSVIDGWDVGIRLQGGAELFVKDTTIRNGNTGVYATTGKTSLDSARLLSNGTGIRAEGAELSVRGSTVAGNTTAGISASAGASVTVEKCQIANNGKGITLPAASGATVRLSRSVVSGNTLGLENLGGTLEVSGNNAVRGNTTNTSGTIVPATLQ